MNYLRMRRLCPEQVLFEVAAMLHVCVNERQKENFLVPPPPPHPP